MAWPPQDLRWLDALKQSSWHVIAREDDLPKRLKRPLKRKLCGVDLALWRDAQGVPQLIHAACPHRGADLTKGRLIGGCAQCPYHGWRFDGQGRCTHIPSRPKDAPIPPQFKAEAPRIYSQQGLIWAHLNATPDEPPPPLIPALDEAKALRTFWVSRTVEAPWLWWIDNMLDTTHVPYTHAKTYGGSAPIIDQLPITRWPDASGFEANLALETDYSLWTKLLHKQRGTFTQSVSIKHYMPSTSVFEVNMPGSKRQLLLSLASPTDAQRTQVWLGVSRNYLKLPGSDLVGRGFVNQVLREDERLSQTAMLSYDPLNKPLAVSVAADAPSLEFFRLLKRLISRET